jgi:predicted amidophosphoribosyltransferase
MSAEPVAVPPSSCPLCEAPAPPETGAGRCPDCGYDLAGVGGRPGAFSRRVLIWTAIGFLLIYVGTLAIVALTK